VRLTLALALAAPILLWSLNNGLSTDHSYTFEIQFASSANGSLQLFYDRGHGITEAESISEIVVAGEVPETLSLALPSGTYRMLRIDPPGAHGRFTIASARIRDWRGVVVQDIPLNDLDTVWQLSRVSLGPPVVFESPPGSTDPQLHWQPRLPVTLALGPQSFRRTLLVGFAEYFSVVVFVLLLERLLRPLSPSAERLLAAWGLAGARRPRTAILVAACVGTVIAVYPIVFVGKSLVSPNIGGTPLLYDRVPFTPGQRDHRVEKVDGVDVGATMWSLVPTSHLQRIAVLEGELPLWNRYNAAGRSLWGQGLSMLMDPLHWVTIITPNPALGWDLKFLIHRAVFAFGVGVAVLTLTGSWAGAAVMALLAPFASQYLSRLNHPAQFSLTYAPWVLWAWFRLASATTRRAIARSAGWLAVTTALLMVASPPKEAVAAILCTEVAGALACFLSRAAPRLQAHRLTAAMIASFIAVLITAPHWLVFLKTLGQSITLYDEPSVKFAGLPFALSLAFGAIAQIGLPPGAHPVAAALALAALFFGRRDVGRASSLGMAIGPAFALAIAFGAIPKQTMLKLPFFANIIHIDFTFAGAAVALLMVSAGVSAAALLGASDTRRSRLATRLSFAACLVCSLILISWSHGISALASYASQWALVFAGVMAALLLLVGRIAARDWPSPMPTIAAGVVALLLVAPDALHVVFNIPVIDAIAMQPTGRADLDLNGAAVDAIHANMSGPARVVGLDATLFAGSQVLYELEGLGGPDPLQLAPYEELINAAGVRRFWWWNQAISAQELQRQGPLLDLLNVGFVLTNHLDENEGLPDGADGLSILPMSGTDRVLGARRPHPWPRAFYVDAVSEYRDVNEFVRQLNGSNGPFASVQSSDEKARSVYMGTPSRRAPVPADQYVLTTNRTMFHLRTPGPGVAVLTDAWMANDFVATLNGVQKPYFRVNHAFKGIRIPAAGDWTVEFRYRPAGWDASLAMAAVGLLGLVVLWRL
jgi:hypothetical protein